MAKLECVGRIIVIYTVCPEGILSSVHVFFKVTTFKNKVVETERGENRSRSAHVQKKESSNAHTKGMRGG
jgi:hypothetical protein